MRRPVAIGVVGAGPRGIIMLERICANAPVLAPGRDVDVHLVDPEPVGGRVWHERQDEHLLMNTVSGDITVFTDESVECDGPLRGGPTQYEWCRMVAAGAVAGLDEPTSQEAASMAPWTYPTRRFQGHYLRWALDHILATAPAKVRVHRHRAWATDLADTDDGRQTLWLEGRDEPLWVDAVVLAQGHFDVAPSPQQAELAEFAAHNGLIYVPPSSPRESDLAGIVPGDPVILRGMGLNFFDYAIRLTESRGGRFVRTGVGKLVYRASGAEPVLFAGSGRGVPYLARAEVHQEVVPRYQPTFLTAAVVERLRRASGAGRLDFVRDLWPYVAKEAGWVYYRKLLELSEGAGSPALARFEAEYPLLEWDSAETPKLIGESVPDTELHLDWEEIDRPACGRNFASREEFGTWVRQRLADDLAHARAGPAASALKATAAMMRDLRDEVRQVISHRGISGASYRRHVDGWFSGVVNFFASGPPARRVEELGALVDADIVRFVGPRMRIDADGSQRLFSACSEAVGNGPVRAAALVEAHLPPTDVRRAADPLLRRLLERGGCRAHRIPNPDGTSFETGGIDVTAGQQRLVDTSGAAHPGRFSYGPPVESVQWVTAIGARPHVNSRTVQQGDAIARAALARAVRE